MANRCSAPSEDARTGGAGLIGLTLADAGAAAVGEAARSRGGAGGGGGAPGAGRVDRGGRRPRWRGGRGPAGGGGRGGGWRRRSRPEYRRSIDSLPQLHPYLTEGRPVGKRHVAEPELGRGLGRGD